MFRKIFKKKGSAYLMALGVLGVLTIVGVTISKVTTSGRWNTILKSNEKRAEECAESATNMMFKVVKDNMNDYSIFYSLISNPAKLLDATKKDFCFLYFRLPTYVADLYMDPVSFEDARDNGIDVQLDLLKGPLGLIYDNGFTFVYDTITPEAESPLSPLRTMFESYGGRIRVTCKGKIKQAFGILSENPKFNVPGVEIPLAGVTGFMGKLFNKANIGGKSHNSSYDGIKDPTGEGNDSTLSFNLLQYLPDDPLLKAPDISNITIIVEGVPVPVGLVLQIPLNKIFDKICDSAGLTIRGLAETIFGDSLTIEIDISGITKRIEEAIGKCLPEKLQAFAGNISHGVTVEKQGIFEVETVVKYWPNDANASDDDKNVVIKKLVAHREFRVADIQPIASDYSFFVANSKKLYEKADIENADDWQGDDQISWNSGNGDLVVHNLPDLKSIINTIKNIFTLKIKDLLRQIQLPGLVRINGTKKMAIKLSMFPKLSFSKDNLRKMEIISLVLGHKEGHTACHDKHSSNSSHRIIPDIKSVTYAFWDNGNPFDWGYFGGGSPDGAGSYWLPVAPRYARNLFFGDFNLEFPFSLRVEGYLTKIYTHINLLLVKIYIPPIPIIGFLGMDIPIPWFWANAYEEPYGYCRFPPYKSDSHPETTWDPNDEHNLPANIYSPAQYLKKASYFYNTSNEFKKDLENRCIEYNGKKTFICDGVTFVNDNLWLKDMHVMGRGIIVSSANVHIDGNITRENYDKDGNATVFSIIARNGSILTGFSKRKVYACLFADRGIQVPIGAGLEVFGNLCVNRCNREDIGGNVDIHYESNHCRSSLLSMIKPIAKYDPTRYHVTFSSKLAAFKFEKAK